MNAAGRFAGVNDFRLTARSWLEANVPLAAHADSHTRGRGDQAVARARELQRMLFDAGFAGIVYPTAYGGQGLGVEYARAFAEEAARFESPLVLQEPTLNIIAPTIHDCGTEAQKLRHLPRILRGEERWVQFLSEPGGGSDVASTSTTADRVDGGFVLNGAKTWSSGADRSDWALCPARTNWDVPKHQGLTVFLVAISQPAIDVRPIHTCDGASNFCEEFLTDVFVADDDVLGAVDGGWSVIMTLINHERKAVAGASPFTGGSRSVAAVGRDRTLVDLALATGRADDPLIRHLVGGQCVDDIVQEKLNARILLGLARAELPETAGTILRLFEGGASARRATIAADISAFGAVAWEPNAPTAGVGNRFLMRQASSIGGGTTEMARNVISERLLGMPREQHPDRGVPFREVARNRGDV